MFKRFRKRRLSLSFKRKSTSLKNLNIMQTFVHQTARIMSASAENLSSENGSSVNLVNILDQTFPMKSRSTTALTNNVSSPKYNDRECSVSTRSYSSETNKKAKSEILLNHFGNSHEELDLYSSDNIEIILEENSLSENINLSNSNYVDMQESPSSRYLDSPQLTITKDQFKRSYSFSDLNVRQISSLNKKHGSVQTFTSTNATLSVEFENKMDVTNYHSETKIFEPLNNAISTPCNSLMKILSHENLDDSNVKMKRNITLEAFNDCLKDSWEITNSQLEKNTRISKGDDQSEINDLLFSKEESELEFIEVETVHSKDTNYFELFEKIVSNPLFLTGVVLTGIIILVPTINKISDWLSNSISEPPPPPPLPPEPETISIIKPLGPEFLFASPLPPIKLLENDYPLMTPSSVKTNFLYNMIHKSFKQINSYLSDRFRKL